LLLSRRFYRHLGKAGVYTRKRGLDRETNKALLVKHIEDNQAGGSRMEELRQVLPALARSQIQVFDARVGEGGIGARPRRHQGCPVEPRSPAGGLQP